MPSWLVISAALAALLAAVAAFGGRSARAIAAWQIAGGATMLFAWASGVGQLVGVTVIAFLSGLSIAGVAIVAGVLLWRGSSRGVQLSMFAQAFQIAWISVPLMQLGSTLGPTIGPRLTSTSITLNFGFYGRGGVVFAPEGVRYPFDITVNVLAVLALIALVRLKKHNVVAGAVVEAA